MFGIVKVLLCFVKIGKSILKVKNNTKQSAASIPAIFTNIFFRDDTIYNFNDNINII